MINYRFEIRYKGHHFAGFQEQKISKTVEGQLKSALRKLFKEEIKIYYSGRTDTGVHGEKQVVNFKSTKNIPCYGIEKVLNGYLKSQIVVSDVCVVDNEFHSRYDAKERTYRYLFTRKEIPIYLIDYVVKINFEPDISKTSKFMKAIEGEHDFAKLRKTGSNELSTIRYVKQCSLIKQEFKCLYNDNLLEVYVFEIVGNGFLRRMVRNIVGLMFDYLQGKITMTQINMLLEAKSVDRFNYTVAPAKGLCLVDVRY